MHSQCSPKTSRRDRRRIERQIGAQRDAARALARLVESGAFGVIELPAGGVLVLHGSGWQLGLADVVNVPVRQLVGARWRLDGAGRYGRFWWVRFAGVDSSTRPVTVLASAVRVAATQAVDKPGSLVVPGSEGAHVAA
jgi:hypothetical protein